MKRSYDAIAGIYDWLAAIAFGKALRKAQLYLVQYIPAGAKVLVAGGGTGWILEEIAKVHSEGLQIDYLDISEKMIALAKKRNAGNNTVHFLSQSASEAFSGNDYDVILTPFFFDNFKENTMRGIFEKLHQKLKAGGVWLYADFQVQGRYKLLQKMMLSVMYTFFRATCNIEANKLPDVKGQFASHGYFAVAANTWKGSFIASVVYRKK